MEISYAYTIDIMPATNITFAQYLKSNMQQSAQFRNSCLYEWYLQIKLNLFLLL